MHRWKPADLKIPADQCETCKLTRVEKNNIPANTMDGLRDYYTERKLEEIEYAYFYYGCVTRYPDRTALCCAQLTHGKCYDA